MKTFFLPIIWLSLMTPVPGQNLPKPPITSVVRPDEKGEAAAAFKEFDFDKLSINPNNLTERKINELAANFLPSVKPHLIKSGERVARLARLAAPVFRFHGAKKSRTVVFDDAVPTVFTWKETFVTFSSGALDLLTDEEITSLAAHEIGHLYFAEELETAFAGGGDGGDRQARIIELKCDLAALTTLTALRIAPPVLLSAVGKLIDERRRQSIGQFRPRQSGSRQPRGSDPLISGGTGAPPCRR